MLPLREIVDMVRHLGLPLISVERADYLQGTLTLDYRMDWRGDEIGIRVFYRSK
jgi:hypothetical protein